MRQKILFAAAIVALASVTILGAEGKNLMVRIKLFFHILFKTVFASKNRVYAREAAGLTSEEAEEGAREAALYQEEYKDMVDKCEGRKTQLSQTAFQIYF